MKNQKNRFAEPPVTAEYMYDHKHMVKPEPQIGDLKQNITNDNI